MLAAREARDLVAARAQEAHDREPEEAAAAGDERSHASCSSAQRLSSSRRILALWRASTGSESRKSTRSSFGSGWGSAAPRRGRRRRSSSSAGSRACALDDEHGPLRAARADADERAAAHLGVAVEETLGRDRQERAGGRLEALRLAAAEPQQAFGVEVADVAHAVPEARAVGDLRCRGRLRIVGVGARDDRAAHADLAQSVLFVDEPDLDSRSGAADAGAVSALDARAQSARDLGACERGDGQRLGSAVRSVHVAARRQACAKAVDERRARRSRRRSWRARARAASRPGAHNRARRGARSRASRRCRSPRALAAPRRSRRDRSSPGARNPCAGRRSCAAARY